MDESFGSVLFKKENETYKFLIIYLRKGNYWGIPKGHPENIETIEETVIREVREETGCEILILPDFVEEIFFSLSSGIKRKVTFLLSRVISESKEMIFSDEISETNWLSFDAAYQKLTFQNSKKVLKNAYDFLLLNHI